MGFRKDWNLSDIRHQLWRMGHECSSSYNDGFTAFEIKKELLELKFLIDDIVEKSPKFSGEEEIYQQRLVTKLKA
jgi:hypothetical protein